MAENIVLKVMMIFALIAFIVIGLVVWSAVSLSVSTGNAKAEPAAVGGAVTPPVSFPSPSDLWSSIGSSGAGMADSAKGAWGSASAAGSSAWASATTAAGGPAVAGTTGAGSTTGSPPGTVGAPAAAAPPGGIFSFIPGWNQVTGTNVNTSVTSIPGAPSIVEGRAYKCSNLDPWAIYRGYNNTLRMYPNPTVAAGWDPSWASPTTIDCSKTTIGPQMEMNPDPRMIEGHSYTCAEGGVYRATAGELRWYPSPAIALSWDPAWASPVKIDCSAVKKGSPMQMAPSPSLTSAVASQPEPVRPDTSALEKRMKEVVDDLNNLNAKGFFNVGNAKIDADEYKTLAPKLTAAGVTWTPPKFPVT